MEMTGESQDTVGTTPASPASPLPLSGLPSAFARLPLQCGTRAREMLDRGVGGGQDAGV